MEERKRERLAFGPAFLEQEDISEEKRLANIAAVEQLAQQEGEGEELMPRIHQADVSEDHKSLDRKGQRNLYLLLHTSENGKDVWRFPQGGVEKGQLLHQVIYYSEGFVCVSNTLVSRPHRRTSSRSAETKWTLGLLEELPSEYTNLKRNLQIHLK